MEDRPLNVPYLRRVGEGAGDSLLAGNVDVLPLAGKGTMSVGQHSAGGGSSRAVQVKVREAGPEGSTIGIASQVHEAAQGHAGDVGRLVVGVGALLPERSYGCHDHAGVDFRKSRIAQANAVQVARVEGLYDEVGGGGQSLQKGTAVGVFQIQS